MPKIDFQMLLRYGYAGFLVAVLLVIAYPAPAKEYIEAGGSVVAPLAILAIGGFVYTIFRHVLGEILIFNLTHCVHSLIDFIFNNNKPTGPTGYLWRVKKINFWQRRHAYTDLMNGLFNDKVNEQLKKSHAETNMVYLTFVVSLIMFILFHFLKINVSNILLFNSVKYAIPILWFSAVYMDILQHRKEFRMMFESKLADDVDGILKEKGYIK
jgi:hypothetical protein